MGPADLQASSAPAKVVPGQLVPAKVVPGQVNPGQVNPGQVGPGRVAARLARHVEVGLSAVDLSLPQYRVLMYLDEGEAASSKLAQSLSVSRPTVTSVVDGLVVRGLVQRRHDPDDRRRIALTLTPAGAEVLAAADRSVEARLHEIVGRLPDQTQATDALRGLECWRLALTCWRQARMEPAR